MDTLSGFGERVVKLPCGKWFIPKFIQFQYGKLSEDCKAHKPIFLSLQKHSLKGYSKGIDTLQEKEKETDKEMEEEKTTLELVPSEESQKTNPLKIRVGKLLGRRPTTKWSAEELRLLKGLGTPDESEMALMEEFYGAEIAKEEDYRRTTIERVLKHWSGETDKARDWKRRQK